MGLKCYRSFKSNHGDYPDRQLSHLSAVQMSCLRCIDDKTVIIKDYRKRHDSDALK